MYFKCPSWPVYGPSQAFPHFTFKLVPLLTLHTRTLSVKLRTHHRVETGQGWFDLLPQSPFFFPQTAPEFQSPTQFRGQHWTQPEKGIGSGKLYPRLTWTPMGYFSLLTIYRSILPNRIPVELCGLCKYSMQSLRRGRKDQITSAYLPSILKCCGTLKFLSCIKEAGIREMKEKSLNLKRQSDNNSHGLQRKHCLDAHLQSFLKETRSRLIVVLLNWSMVHQEMFIKACWVCLGWLFYEEWNTEQQCLSSPVIAYQIIKWLFLL